MQQKAGPFAQARLVKPAGQRSPDDNRLSDTLRRYVGVNQKNEPEEGFDFEKTLRVIHVELAGFNKDAAEFTVTIANEFEGFDL